MLRGTSEAFAAVVGGADSIACGPFDEANDLFARLDEAAEAIDDEAIAAEVNAALDGELSGETPEIDQALAEKVEAADADDELAKLKLKLLEEKQAKAKPKQLED